MDHYTQYMAEEVAENCRDGLLTRREAMRRLSYLGVTTVSASALLAACGGDDDDETAGSQSATTSGQTTPTTAAGPTTTAAAVPAQDITFAGNGITIRGAFAPASTPRGAVLVIHENMGLTPFVRSMAGRLAASGYSALAIDLLSAQGGTATFTDPATIGPALNENARTRSVGDMKAGLTELQRRVPNQKLAAIGFCFGGTMVWDLLAAGDPPPLAAALPFYGTANTADFTKTKAAVLAVYAENDARVNANQATAVGALRAANLTHEAKTFPGVNHAFMRAIEDPAQPAYAQAVAAYQQMIDWFSRHLR
jgi:carboxymethylenebutenolidase